jgi:3-isopropylmalate dehydrogenase
MLLHIAALPGDGIGPEVTREAIKILEAVAHEFHHELRVNYQPIGGAALISHNDPAPAQTLQACRSSHAVLLGAVGGPAFDDYPRPLRPEAGLLRLRKGLEAFANLRPAICFAQIVDASPLRPELVKGTDMLIVRELLGGLYFGEPRAVEGKAGDRSAVNTMRYREFEVERIARVAFQLARSRKKKLLSVDKANVLECSRLWREIITQVAAEFPDVQLSHMYVDSAAMSLVMRPKEFDVVVTENMFGDILSDQAGGVVGSLGMLASASIGGDVGLYEPVHGSAPDIAGKNVANPLAAILTVGMLLRHSFSLAREAACVEAAVVEVLEQGSRTRDLARAGQPVLTTAQMGDEVKRTFCDLAKRFASHATM